LKRRKGEKEKRRRGRVGGKSEIRNPKSEIRAWWGSSPLPLFSFSPFPLFLDNVQRFNELAWGCTILQIICVVFPA
jgi:hypothetical protein